MNRPPPNTSTKQGRVQRSSYENYENDRVVKAAVDSGTSDARVVEKNQNLQLPQRTEKLDEAFQTMAQKPELFNRYLDKKITLLINQKLLENLSKFKFSMGTMFDSFVSQNRIQLNKIVTKMNKMEDSDYKRNSNNQEIFQKVKI